MIEPAQDAPIHFAGGTLGDFRHVCGLFSTTDEEYETILPFIREGIAAGERVVNFMPEDRVDHEDRLRAGGIDVDEARKLHQLEIVKSENVYLLPKEGHFDAEAMLQLVPALLRKGYEFGFRVTRFVAHLEHTTRNEQDVDAAMEYESRLNYILPTYPHPIVCAYDLNKVDGGVVRDVLRTHPMVVVEGVMKENPFFLPPDRFLREVRERRRNQKKPQ